MLEYHRELEFVELEYEKSGRSPFSFETVLFPYKVYENVEFDNFHYFFCAFWPSIFVHSQNL